MTEAAETLGQERSILVKNAGYLEHLSNPAIIGSDQMDDPVFQALQYTCTAAVTTNILDSIGGLTDIVFWPASIHKALKEKLPRIFKVAPMRGQA
jgi:hypothetical protein